jgi:ribosomal protein S1
MCDEWMTRLVAAQESGENMEGTVIGIERFGAFLTFGGVIDALLHEKKFKHAKGVKESFEIGQKVKVKVIHAVAGEYRTTSVSRQDVVD